MTFMEELARELVMNGRITPNTARMMLGDVPADESKMKLHPILNYRKVTPPPPEPTTVQKGGMPRPFWAK